VQIVESLQPLRGATTLITADAGDHSEANLRALDTMSVEALITDRDMRKRAERFATQGRQPIVRECQTLIDLASV